jgi:hypothetical protein
MAKYELTNKAVHPYTLPDNTKINLMTNQYHIFMVFDSLGRPASTKKLDDVASISIVPNPNKGNFKLSIDKGQFNQMFNTIYSGSGQVILNKTRLILHHSKNRHGHGIPRKNIG